MPTDSPHLPRSLPERPDLRHLKDQAKDLLRAGHATSLTDAQFRVARLYGFPSWPRLKAHVESLQEVGQLHDAINTNDLKRVKVLMTRNPALHRAPLGYAKNGPLTWVAECRVPWEPPNPKRLAIAKWMIEHGSDVHQGGDGPLMRAALNRDRLPMMEILVSFGADVNALWNSNFPIIWAACEAVDPVTLKWLLEQGADPNCRRLGRQRTALDYLIADYVRSPEFRACMELLIEAGGVTRYDVSCVLDLLRGQLDRVATQLDRDPPLVHRQFPQLDFGNTAGRRLTLEGATLLHLAAEFGDADAAKLLVDRGADVNARAALNETGVGGQTPIFHAASQVRDWGFEVTQVLIDRGADLSVRVKLPGHYERPEEIVECTPLGYAELFPGGDSKTVQLLRRCGALE
jgi:ankyrin repeat protein